MPRKQSTVKNLDPRILEEVNAAVRDGRASIDEIVALIQGLGGDASRSAVARYVKNEREEFDEFQKAQAVADVWAKRFQEDPKGDTAQLLMQMLRTISFKTFRSMNVEGKEVGPMELMLLGKAMDHFAKADKTAVDRQQKVDQLVKARMEEAERKVQAAASTIEGIAKRGGLSKAAAAQIRNEILGITKQQER